MRARVHTFWSNRVLEMMLALLGVFTVIAILFDPPSRFTMGGVEIDRFTVFPFATIVAAWLPLLARRRTERVGELVLHKSRLHLRNHFGLHRLGYVRGVHVARGRRGASALFEVKNGLVAAEVDDADGLDALAARTRALAAEDFVRVPTATTRPTWFARVAVTLFASGYYLHVVHRAIPGEKALYGIGAIVAGLVLLVLHFVRARTPLVVPSTDRERRARGPEQVALGDLGQAMRARIDAHEAAASARRDAPPSEPGARVISEGESAAAALGRIRRALAGAAGDAYRGAAVALRTSLERAASGGRVPVADRALALRVLADGNAVELTRRIATDASAEDEAAAELVARRTPRFEA